MKRKTFSLGGCGENVSSQEVEEAISQHSGVAEVAVIGLPDPYWIEKVVACVVPMPGANPTEEELLAYARKRLASFKVPTAFTSKSSYGIDAALSCDGCAAV